MTHSTRDLTPSPPYKSFVCVIRPIHTCDMPLWCVCNNSFYAWQPPLRVLCLRDMTRLYVRKDFLMCHDLFYAGHDTQPPLQVLCLRDMTHSLVRNVFLMCVRQLILCMAAPSASPLSTWNESYDLLYLQLDFSLCHDFSYVGHDTSPPCEPFIYVTWPIHMCDMTLWYVCAITRSMRMGWLRLVGSLK